MKKISNHSYIFQKVLDYLGVAFLGMLLLFLWQLYRGPIEVPFLKPYIMQALNQDSSEAEIRVKSVSIELVRSLQPIKIVARDIIYRRNDESVSIKAPRTTVSFSLKALLHGVVAPSSIAVENPLVYVFSNYGIKEDEKNETGKKKFSYYTKFVEDFLERFTSDDNSYAESYINSIRITGGELELHEVDLGRKWSFSDLNYSFDRNFLDISTEVNALINLENDTASIGVEAKYKTLQKKLALDIYVSDVVLENMMNAVLGNHPLQELYQLNLPVSGRISTLINIENVLENSNDIVKMVDTAFEQIKIQFEGGQGTIGFSDNKDDDYKITSFLLEGDISGGMDKISIKDASFDLGGQKAFLGFDISGFKNYFFEQSIKDLKIKLSAKVDSMEVNKLYDYWPKYIATPGWNWCNDSMHDGIISNARFVFDFATDAKTQQFGFQNLTGVGDVEGVTLDYLTGMPKIKNAKGKADFTKHNIKITAYSGESDGVQLTGGYVDLYDLDKEDNFADIHLQMESSVADALRVIDHEPLHYTSEMGLKPDTLGGMAKTDLSLKFEMKQSLTPAEVNVKVMSDISDFKMDNVIKDKSLTADALKLEVTNKGLLVEGDAFLEDIPIQLKWKENFISKKYRSRYNIGFKFDDELEKKLGINISVLNPPFITGYADVNAEITVINEHKMDIILTGKLNPMDVDFSFLGFRKKLNENGEFLTKIQIEDEKIKAIPELQLKNTDMSLKGKLGIDAKQRVNLVDIYDIKGKKTNAKAIIKIAYEPTVKATVDVSGQSYDLSPFFEKNEEKSKADKEDKKEKDRKKRPENEDDELEKTIDADISIAVDNLWTNPHIPVTNLIGKAKLVNGIGIKEIHMAGNYKTGKNSMMKVDYTPRSNNEFYLEVDSNDAGATMKVLRLYDDMEGGNLKIEARRNKDKAFVGHAKIRNFNIHNTPLVAKFLTVASFKGMLDLLMGDGIAFSHLDAPFEYRHKQLMLKKAKAFGNVLGITANGTYDRYYEELDIRGQVAPAYSLNMILGSIPVVGNLLAGKDGTVFAADYDISGDVDDAEIDINPLSALSPNSLKETISSLFGSTDE